MKRFLPSVFDYESVDDYALVVAILRPSERCAFHTRGAGL